MNLRLFVLAAMALQPTAMLADPLKVAKPDFSDNFGFPLSFDVSKMDPKASPRQDFSRYAAGRWLDAATIPSDRYAVSGVELMMKHVENQVQAVLADAAARAPGAVKGTPLQQVVDLYASGMDVGRLTLLKAEPIKSEWARIEAIDSKQVLAESIAHFSLVLSDGTMFGSGILPEPRDNTQYTIAFLGATLPMAARENYLSPDMAKVREAYRTMVVKYHLIAGVPLAEAQTRADKILAIESRVAGKQLTPEQARNPSLRLKPMTYDALKALVSNFDLDTFYQAMGLPIGHDVYVLDDGNVRERNAILGDLPLADVKVLLQWDLLRGAQPYLTPEFTEPSMELSRVLYGNMLRLNEFDTRRNLAKFGKPVSEDGFVDPRATLPTVVNAAYSSDRNGIEIPAAFLQPPFYTPNADAGVNFCTLGAVIGHEITHGFDSSGRLYDAQGNVRDWWAPEDTKAFIARSQNLVKQAAAYEVVPGTHLNGELSSGENLADIGGLTLAYDALGKYLNAHPKENRRIDGLTPQQRCFVAWAQNWADKKQPGMLKQEALTDGHPPGTYRMFAPAQDVPGFYATFGIKPGDRMWVDPKDRVSIW